MASFRSKYRRFSPQLLILPVLLILFAINIFPFVFALYSSFTSLNLMTIKKEGMPFVGLDNYLKYTITDPVFQKSIIVTLGITVFAVSLQLFAGLFIAFLLNQEYRGIGIARSLVMIPMTLSPMAVGLMFKIETQQEIGIITFVLERFLGITFLPLSNAGQALAMVILVNSWMWTPFVALVLLAGLKSIPVDLLETAKLDCRNSFQTFQHIMLPCIRFQIILVILIRTMDTFKIFDLIYILTGGAPSNSTQAVSYWIYKVGLEYMEIGKASAMAFIILIIVILISTNFVKIMQRR